MELAKVVFGILGNIISIALRLVAPMPTFWRIYKRGTTEEFSADPYVASLVSCEFWLFYGILSPHGLLIAVDAGIGCALQAFYLCLYLWFANKQQRVKVVCLLGLSCMAVLIIVVTTLFFIRATIRILIMGILSDVSTIAVYYSPLTIVGLVIKTKSVEFMPFWLTFFLCLAACIWTTYGVILRDLFVEVPNAIGVLLGFVQLFLYIIYWKPLDRGLASSKIEITTQLVHEASIEILDCSNHDSSKKQLN
eukprot:c100_g1_i1 orf=58-807(-)